MALIHVVGSGVVGQATGRGLAQQGHRVRFVDVDIKTVLALREEGFEAFLPQHADLADVELVFLSVTAGTSDQGVDLGHLIAAVRTLGLSLRRRPESKPLVVFRCTMPPGTTRSLLIPELEDASGRRAGQDFGVVYNPEYLRAHSAESDFLHPRLVTIATSERDSWEHRLLASVMEPFGAPIRWLPIEVAEFQKYVNNVGNAIKVSTYNWFRQYADACGLPAGYVEEAFELSLLSAEGLWHPPYGTRPFGAYGGACLPKDIQALIHDAGQRRVEVDLLAAVERINESAKQTTAPIDLVRAEERSMGSWVGTIDG